ncbi:MAG: calcium/sodium antiporter [Cytophagales bacterium]|nr:calcium/sodium antiporter [Cytophagales bacterium]MDW8385322.1 calcium/sodium antiporter [Flammeovirgaceae bacterium]
MLRLFFSILLVIVGFGLLTWGAYWLIKGASSIAKHFHLSDIAIGMTVVAIGTSAPELFVNLVAGIIRHDEMVFANVIGSNIFNIFMILGFIGIFRKVAIRKKNVLRELPYSIISFSIVFVLINDRLFFNKDIDTLSQQEALIVLTLYFLFLIYVLIALRKNPEEITENPILELSLKISWLYTIGGIIFLGIGGFIVVEQTKFITSYLQLTTKLLSLTLVAIGTSLPELTSSISAAKHYKIDIAIGNILGSNILNIMFILPLSAIFDDLNYNNQLNFDYNIMIIGTALLLSSILTSRSKRLAKWEAIFFIIFYMAYMYFLTIRG